MRIVLVHEERQQILESGSSETLLAALQTAGVALSAPCGGRGTCGKCRVQVEGLGSVLACQTHLTPDWLKQAGLDPDAPLRVSLAPLRKAQITTSGVIPETVVNPLVVRASCKPDLPSITDQRSDEERFFASGGARVPLRLLGRLPALLRQNQWVHYALRSDLKQVVAWLEPGEPLLGLAVDIGTTTLAAYLCDLEEGRLISAHSMLNPQQTWGADVISRIEQASLGHLDDLRQAIARAIIELANQLLSQTGTGDGLKLIRQITLAGNTTMMHLLAGLPPDAIAVAPFIPVSVRSCQVTASELDWPFAPETIVTLLPSMSGYVGADIAAGLVATGIGEAFEPDGPRRVLLLDIGTNGEIVLSGSDGLLACSTAAGPAFEGANIRCGIGGVEGAIDAVQWNGSDLELSCIGNAQAGQDVRGICGSGLISAVALFLELGLIDETGRFTEEPEMISADVARRFRTIDGQDAVMLAQNASGSVFDEIVLTQKDIREVQNAKAAIAAGIEILLSTAGIQAADLDEVCLAGGFGAHIDVSDALRIGLLPAAFAGKVRVVGNSSGMGAVAVLLQQDLLAKVIDTLSQVRYIELSSDKRFTDLYIDAMVFPE